MNNIKDIFVSYDIANKLKEKRFDEECLGWYDGQKTLRYPSLIFLKGIKQDNLDYGHSVAPTHQQVFNWLRKKSVYLLEEPQREENPAYYVWKPGYHNRKNEDGPYLLDKAIETALKLI